MFKKQHDVSLEQLLQQKVEIDEAIRRRSETELSTLLAKFHALASALGQSLQTILGITTKTERTVEPKPETKREVKAKYRDPVTGAEYSGRGKHPRWLKDYVEAGRNPDEFLIERAPQDEPAAL